jgi:hypothetical protein
MASMKSRFFTEPANTMQLERCSASISGEMGNLADTPASLCKVRWTQGTKVIPGYKTGRRKAWSTTLSCVCSYWCTHKSEKQEIGICEIISIQNNSLNS